MWPSGPGPVQRNAGDGLASIVLPPFHSKFLYPSPRSIVFWDANVLTGYLLLNIVIGWNVLEAERNGVSPPGWIKPLIVLSIPWAFAIHTVTAFLYCGLPGRGFWLTAVMAPRFLASAFSSGPALLILLCLLIRRKTASRKSVSP